MHYTLHQVSINSFLHRTITLTQHTKPDLVLPRHRTDIFVHGCFWHGHELCPAFRRGRILVDSASWKQTNHDLIPALARVV
jgi:G:T-mismatch repair DNA endonuclease (very short patch repair protein)